MRLEHNFTVPVPVDSAWEILLDLPRIAPCMPGATLTGFDGDTFTGTVKVKLGPIALTYSGKGRFVERDVAAHRVVVEASGRDTRSAGTAAATVTAVLAAASDGGDRGDATHVEVITDLTVTGRPAQFGRSMIADVSAKLIGQFADCVARTLRGAGPADAAAGPPGSTAAGPPGSTAAGEPAAPAAPAAATTPAATALAEAEPIDLLRLTGSTATARRLAGYGIAGLLLAVLAWLAVRRVRR